MNGKSQAVAKKTVPTDEVEGRALPVLAAPEEMFEKFNELSREIASRAFDFFRERGGGFGRELDDWFKAENEFLRPVAVEITESKDGFFITAAVPGYKPEEIEISVKDNLLILSGNTEGSKKAEEADTIVREWNSNRFFRQFTLPSEIDTEKIVAKLNNGMLELTVPKLTTEEPTKVAVTSA